jgi:hypothetical protein
MKGIVNVSKLNVVLVAFDVIPAVIKLVVVMELAARIVVVLAVVRLAVVARIWVVLIVMRLAVDAVLSVVHCTNGIVRVEKLNTVLDAFDVNPAQTKLVVTTAFEA